MIHDTAVSRTLLVAAALSVCAPILAHDVARPAPQQAAVQWSPDFAAALAAAREENRILVICFNMDGEAANERALAMYASEEFVEVVEEAICVMCSADEHAQASAPCSRFGGLRCAEHRDCERAARAHLYGARRDNVAPQHVVLYPDGVVAWHGVYEHEPRTILRAIRDAEATKQAPVTQRVRRQRLVVEQLRRRAKTVPAAYMQVLATLASTPPANFMDAFRVLGTDVAATVLDDLATFSGDVPEALLVAASKHSNRALREQADRLLTAVRARPAPVADPAPTEAPRPGNAVPELPQVPDALAAPLPEIGKADSFGRVYWVGEEPKLEDCRGRVTVLWFFQPDASDLAAEVARMSEFARNNADRGVQVFGFAVALRPSELVEELGALGCTFRVGAYQATNANRFFGIERFPAWGVLDPEARLVFRSPQASSTVSRTVALDLARTMAASPVYAAALRAPQR